MAMKYEQPTTHHFLVTSFEHWIKKGNLIEAVHALPKGRMPSEYIAIWWVPGDAADSNYAIDGFQPNVIGARLVFCDRGAQRDDQEGLTFGKGVVRVKAGRNWVTVAEDSLTLQEIEEYGL